MVGYYYADEKDIDPSQLVPSIPIDMSQIVLGSEGIKFNPNDLARTRDYATRQSLDDLGKEIGTLGTIVRKMEADMERSGKTVGDFERDLTKFKEGLEQMSLQLHKW